MADDEKFIDRFDFLDALRDVITASDPVKRQALWNTIPGWSSHYDQETYFWAIGPKAPTFLNNLMMEIEIACDPDAKAKPPRPVIRLADRKPQGNA
jgi:hypothetical protein